MAQVSEFSVTNTPNSENFKFVSISSKPRGTPSTRLGKIVFAYSKTSKSYVLYDSNRTYSLFEAMCRRNNVPKVILSNMLQSISDSFNSDNKRPPPSESKSSAYSASMKILNLAIICFISYIILVFLEIYEYSNSGSANIGVIFGYLGLFLSTIVILGQGKIKICLPSFRTPSIFIDSYHRHEVFEILTKTIQNLNGLVLNLGKHGQWIELEENE